MTRYGDYTEISDEDRLLWLINACGIDQIGGKDLHELACAMMAARMDYPTEAECPDMLEAIRCAIDSQIG